MAYFVIFEVPITENSLPLYDNDGLLSLNTHVGDPDSPNTLLYNEKMEVLKLHCHELGAKVQAYPGVSLKTIEIDDDRHVIKMRLEGKGKNSHLIASDIKQCGFNWIKYGIKR